MNIFNLKGHHAALLFLTLGAVVSLLALFLKRSLTLQCPENASMAVAMSCQTAQTYLGAVWVIAGILILTGATLLFVAQITRKAMAFDGDDIL
jgi:nitrate reductase gamma subunit